MQNQVPLSELANVAYGSQFTVEIVLSEFELPPRVLQFGPRLPWLTLFAAGETPESTVWEEPPLMTGAADRPLLRIGLANKSSQLMAEIVDLGQVSPVQAVSQAQLPNRDCTQLAVTVNADEGEMRLYIDSKQAAPKQHITSSVKLPRLHSVFCGSGSTVPAVYYRVWRRCLTPDELAAVKCREIDCKWDDTFEHPNLGLDISVSRSDRIAWSSIVRSESGKILSHIDQLAERVLRFQGGLGTGKATKVAKRKAASSSLSEITNRLSKLLEDEDTAEPTLLAFFKECPAAAVLFDPLVSQQWREVLLQDHGQIDFVLENALGRFLAVEIESPKQRLFTTNDEIKQSVFHAIDQVEKWKRGLAKANHAAEKRFGTSDHERFDCLVVIGRGKDVSNDERKCRWNDWSRKGVSLRTWDDLIAVGDHLVKQLSGVTVAESAWR